MWEWKTFEADILWSEQDEGGYTCYYVTQNEIDS